MHELQQPLVSEPDTVYYIKLNRLYKENTMPLVLCYQIRSDSEFEMSHKTSSYLPPPCEIQTHEYVIILNLNPFTPLCDLGAA